MADQHVPGGHQLQADEGWCCLDDCCGPGSWCCAHANPHTHTDDGEVVPVDAAREHAPRRRLDE